MESFGRVVVIVLVLELIAAGFALYIDGYTLTGLQTITRFSGRLSLIIFSVIFLFRNKPGGLDTIILYKPYHFFALAHSIHLLQLMAFLYLSDNTLNPVRAAGGTIAYAFIFLMPFAADRMESGRLPIKKYQTMEVIFLYYIWFIFFMTYLPRVRGTLQNVGGSYWEHVALLGWVSILLGVKLTGLIKFRTSTSK